MQELLADFEDLDELYRCYMPFLKSGGIFIKSNAHFDMGQELKLRVTLPDALEADEVEVVVSWLTPQGAQNSNPPGVGVAFVDAPALNDKINKLLGATLHSDKPTYTM